METLSGRAYSLKQHTQFSILNILLNHLASNINGLLKKATVFLHSLERCCIAQSWWSSPLKTLTVRKHSFQMLTQLTMHNKVQGPLACNISASLTELQCFSLSLEWGDSAERWCCLSRKTLRCRQYFFKQQNEFTILTNLPDSLVSNIKGFSWKNAVFLPFTCMRWFCTKVMFLTHEKAEGQAAFFSKTNTVYHA
jgi:hypothetical protein